MINKLDPQKTYIALQYGTSRIAKKIKKYTKIYCPESTEVPTHILALVFRLGDWWIYESHLKGNKKLGIPSGVRRYKLSIWLKKENVAEYKFYPIKVSLKKLEEYVGQPYGTGDIASLLLSALLHNNGKQKDREGLICSEYIALCIPAVCKYLSLPAWCITPAHFKRYFDEIGLDEVKND